MTLCWLFGHVWAITFVTRAMVAYRGDERRELRAKYCVCCGAHQLEGAIP